MDYKLCQEECKKYKKLWQTRELDRKQIIYDTLHSLDNQDTLAAQQLKILCYIQEANLNGKILCLGKVDGKNQQHIDFLRKIHLHKYKFSQCNMIECNITQQLLNYFDAVQYMKFIGCFLGDRLSSMLLTKPFSQNYSSYIREIVISSDLIGNKGIKKLMGLNLQSLRHLRIDNSNITTDSVKLLRHKKWKCLLLGINMQQHFHYNAILKQMTHIKQQPNWLAVEEIYQFSYHTFMYWGLMSKLAFDSHYGWLDINWKYKDFLKRRNFFMIPRRTLYVLSRNIDISKSKWYNIIE